MATATHSNVLNRYWPVILQIAITVITAFTVLPKDAFVNSAATWASVIGLVVLAVQAIVTYLVPLVSGPWQGALKTGSAVVLAILGGILQFIVQGQFTPTTLALVLLAGLNALASEVGVQVRLDDPALVGKNEVRAKSQVTTAA